MRLEINTYRILKSSTGGLVHVNGESQNLVGLNIYMRGSQFESPFVTCFEHCRRIGAPSISIINRVKNVIFVIGDFMSRILEMNERGVLVGNNRSISRHMKRKKSMENMAINISRLAMVAMVSLSGLFAKGTPQLDIRIDDQKINLSSDEKLTPQAVSYSPGDTLRYVITASNVGDGLMTDPAVVDPIPAGVTYIPNTASGENAEISFSINQGNTYMTWPPYYTVRNAKGILVKRKATAEMVSHIKWDIVQDLKPAEKSDLEFLVVVNK